MKNLVYIIILFVFSTYTQAQEFTVKSVTGKVLVQKESGEKLLPIKPGDLLSGGDLIVTEKESKIRLEKNGETFVLEDDAAVNLNYIRKISLNDLLLALAMEELKDLPKDNGRARNTAVYGSEEIADSEFKSEFFDRIGKMKINGAKQLAEKGYKESAILAAKETFRKYPNTRKSLEDRLFLFDLLYNMKLYEEAASELKRMRAEFNSENEADLLKNKEALLKAKLSE